MKYGLQFTATKSPTATWHHDAVENSNDDNLKSLLYHYMAIVDPNAAGPFRMRILSKNETEMVSITWHDTASNEKIAEDLIVMWSMSFPDTQFQEYMNWKRSYNSENNIEVRYSAIAIADNGEVILNPTSDVNFVAQVS